MLPFSMMRARQSPISAESRFTMTKGLRRSTQVYRRNPLCQLHMLRICGPWLAYAQKKSRITAALLFYEKMWGKV